MTAALLLVFGGVVFLAVGVPVYLGTWRSWTRSIAIPNFVLVTGWFGVAGVFAGLSALLLNVPPAVVWVPLGLFVVAFVSAALAFYSVVVGMPQWMQPRWYRGERLR